MKRYLLLPASLLLFIFTAKGQTVIWSDNFDAPAGGANNNNAGAGWTGAINTPGGGQNTSFLGFSNTWAIGANATCSAGNKLYVRSTLQNSNAFISDVFTDKYNATPNINTTGYSGLVLKFTWRCNGTPGLDYGLVGLSSDGGTTWNWLSTQYQGQASCTQATIPVPSQYENITNFKVAFRFVSNATSCGTCDPPFNIDNILLEGNNSSTCTTPTVNAGSNVSICPGQSVVIGGSPTATGGSPSNYVYTWSPATNISSTSVSNPSVTPTSTTTYTVSVNGGDVACTATSSITVTVNTPQSLGITASGPLSICPGGNVTLTATPGFTNYVWTTPSGSQNGASITASQAGAYSVTAVDANTCNSTSSVTTITLATPQTLGITASGALSVCPGGSVTLTASAGFTNYQWTTPAGIVNGSSVIASQPGAYSVAATDANGCNSTSTITNLTSISVPTLSITPSGSTTICPGSSVDLTATAGFTNYQWTTPEGPENGQTIEAGDPGLYSLSATFSGCAATATGITISEVSVPDLSVTPEGLNTICPGASIPLSAAPGFSNYQWSGPSGTLSGATINASVAGVYTASADFGGCNVTSDDITIALVSVPTLSTSPSGTIAVCPGETPLITASPGFTNYVWTTPSGSVTGASITANQDGNYSVTANFLGCAATSSSVAVSTTTVPELSITASGPTEICVGLTVGLTATPGFTGYAWNTPGGNQTGTSITASQVGNYSVSASFSGCSASSEVLAVTAIALPPLTTTPSGSISLCPGQTQQITAASGFLNYTWQTPTGNQTGPNITGSAIGNYTVSATFNGCSVSALPLTISIGTTQTLAVTTSGPLQICPEGQVTLTAASGFINYQWSNGDTGPSSTINAAETVTVTADDPNGCDAISQPISVSLLTPELLSITNTGTPEFCPGESVSLFAASGFVSYSWDTPTGTQTGLQIDAEAEGEYQVTAIDQQGCTTDPVSIQVVETDLPALSIVVNGSSVICTGSTVELQATEGFESYLWTTPTGSSFTTNSITAGFGGAYLLSAEIDGCTVNAPAQVISVDPPFQIQVSPAGPFALCGDETVVLTAAPGYSNYVWSTNESGTQLEVNSSGGYSVSATNANGCSGSSSIISVTQQDFPVAGFTYEQTSGLYEIMFTSTSSNVESYFWDFGFNQTSILPNPSNVFPFDGEWPVSLVVSNSCGSDTLNMDVTVIKLGIHDLDGVESLLISQGDGSFVYKGQNKTGSMLRLTVMAIDGRKVWEGETGNEIEFWKPIPAHEWSSGVYTLIVDVNGHLRSLRFTR